MRFVPILCFAMLPFLPLAQASDDGNEGPIGQAITAVQTCLNAASDVESCEEKIEGLANLACQAIPLGCFLCVEFIPDPKKDLLPKTRGLPVSYNPTGEVILSWHGVLPDNSEKGYTAGTWQIQWSKSQEFWCSGQ